MTCAYCSNAAAFTDLCHGPLPVCDDHVGTGHQLLVLDWTPPPARRAAAPEAAPEAEPVPLTTAAAPQRKRVAYARAGSAAAKGDASP